MSTVRRIAKNTVFLTSSEVVSGIIGFVFVVFAARYLGAGGFGKYSFVVVLIGIVSIFGNFGLDTLLIRDVARDRSRAFKYLANTLVIKFILALVIIGSIYAAVGLTNLTQDQTKTSCLLIFSWSIIFSLTSQTLWALADAYEEMQYHSLLSIFSNLLRVGVGLFLIFRGYGLLTLFQGLLAAAILSSLTSFVVVTRRFGVPKLEIDPGFGKYLIKASWPFALLGILGMVYLRIDIIMLSAMKGDQAVGWYNAAYGLIMALMFISGSFVAAIFPVMLRHYKMSQESLRLIYEKSVKYLIILGLPIAVGTTILASRIIFLFFGEQYLNSVMALQILIWALLMFFVNAPYGRILVVLNKEKLWLGLGLINTLLNIGLNFLLIPKMSYIGAGIATLITEITGFGFNYYMVSKFLYRLAIWKLLWKPAISAALMLGAIYLVKDLNLTIIIVAAGLVYFASNFLTGNFSEDDREIFRKVFKVREVV